MKRGGLVGRLTITIGFLTSGIVLLVALSIVGLVYLQTELQIKNDLSRAATSIIRDELMSEHGQIGLQKKDNGQSLAVLLRNLDMSLYVTNASGSSVASYGIYRTTDASDFRLLLLSLSPQTLKKPVYRDQQLAEIGRVDTYTVPLLEGSTTMGMMQLTRINNMWPIISKALLFSFVLMAPLIWSITFLAIRWGTRKTLAPLSELVSSVESLDVDQLPERLVAPHSMDHDVATLHKTLEILMERIRKTISRQREISENLSHEFKTPLTRITSTLGVLSSSLRMKEKDVVSDAIHELVQLGEQVDGLLDVAMYGSSMAAGEWIPMKIFIEKLAAHSLHDKQEMRVDIPPTFQVRLPIGHARIICRNLLENAMKYKKAGSIIRIRSTQDHEVWSLIFENTVENENVPHGDIFKRKYRETPGKAKGYGLGLAIVRDVAKQLGLTVGYAVKNDQVEVTVSGKFEKKS